jgi:uncharacterized membrane protein YciS (DUF1049 family)
MESYHPYLWIATGFALGAIVSRVFYKFKLEENDVEWKKKIEVKDEQIADLCKRYKDWLDKN